MSAIFQNSYSSSSSSSSDIQSMILYMFELTAWSKFAQLKEICCWKACLNPQINVKENLCQPECIALSWPAWMEKKFPFDAGAQLMAGSRVTRQKPGATGARW